MAKPRLNGELLRTAGVGKMPSKVDADRPRLRRLRKWTAWAVGADDRSPATMPGPSRGLLSNRSWLPSRLDFACAGRLQQSEALARGLLRILVALSFVLDFQAGPFIRVGGPEVGSFELAIGGGLR